MTFKPFIIRSKLTNEEFLVIQYYERRYTGQYVLVSMDTFLFSIIDETKLRQNYKFVKFYAQ